jgi:hypothetical protein
MKINILEAHDRLQEFKKQSDYISEGCQDCIKNRPEEFGNHSFYIFAHKREIGLDERINIFTQDLQESLVNRSHIRKYIRLDQIPTHRMIWTPRLTKPTAQTNSMLFKSYPPSDTLKVIWIIPSKETWDQYLKDKLTESKIVCESIQDFKNNRSKLEVPEEDDLNDSQADAIYTMICSNAHNKKMMDRLYKI